MSARVGPFTESAFALVNRYAATHGGTERRAADAGTPRDARDFRGMELRHVALVRRGRLGNRSRGIGSRTAIVMCLGRLGTRSIQGRVSRPDLRRRWLRGRAVAVDRCSRVASPPSPCSPPDCSIWRAECSRGDGACHLDGVTGAHRIGIGRWRRRGVDPRVAVCAIATGSQATRDLAGPLRAARRPGVSWDQRERGVCDDR
jgi:hypothetical protein